MAKDGNDDNGIGDSGDDNDGDNGGGGNGGGGGWSATAATDSVVWGRHQAARGREMGIKWKWEQCGYGRWKSWFSKIVT